MIKKEKNKHEILSENKEISETILKKIKKRKILILSMIFSIVVMIGVIYLVLNQNNLRHLPKPEITSGARGELGIDKNINETTIDKYLFRKDSVYRDMRMLEDPGKYEKIGGDRFLSGYIKGFEVISLPYIIPVTGLPKEVGDTYIGETLFHEENGKYIANYKESMDIIEKIFPKDKIIFLMCGGGGYAGITKNFLVSLGWDESKIYNVGGYWYYKGKYSIDVKKKVKGKVTYDFDNVPYHKIKFNKLTKSADYKAPNYRVNKVKISTSKLEIEEGTSFKLNAIVLPNEAANKEVKWKSSNENIATVNSEGLVVAIKEGTVKITVTSVDKNKKASCKVTVKKKPAPAKLKIDDVSNEKNELSLYDLDKIRNEKYAILYKADGNFKDAYRTIDEEGHEQINDSGREINIKYEKKLANALNKRVEIFNKLLDSKKTFIVLVHTKICDERDFQVADAAARILDQNNYTYIILGQNASNGDETIEKSKLDRSNYKWGSIIIIKNGSIYASIDPEKESIKSEIEAKNWLNKYIDVR